MIQYYAVAMITIFLYEYILLLPDEVRMDLRSARSVAGAEAKLIYADRVRLVVEQGWGYVTRGDLTAFDNDCTAFYLFLMVCNRLPVPTLISPYTQNRYFPLAFLIWMLVGSCFVPGSTQVWG